MKQKPPERCLPALCPAVLIALVWGLFVCGCDRSGGIDRKVAAARALTDLNQRHDRLLALSLQDPRNPALLYELGRASFDMDRFGSARVYLDQARVQSHGPIRRVAAGPQLTAPVLADAERMLASIAVHRGDAEAAIVHATAALQGARSDDARLIRARAHLLSARYRDAIDDFRKVSVPLDQPDLDRLLVALRGVGDWAGALAVLDARSRRFGYRPGHGVEEAQLLQWNGRPDRAVAASLMEAEYLRYHRRLPDSQLLHGLRLLEVSLDSSPEGSTAGELLSGYRLFVREEWEAAAHRFGSLESRLEHPFVQYAALVSRFRSGLQTDSLSAYAELEPIFYTTQFYYDQLWRMLRQQSRGYSVLTVRELLERTILLSPGSPAAMEARRELGRLLGLEAEAADLLLLGPELEAIVSAVRIYRDPRLLDTILDTLSISETVYTTAAIIALHAALDIEYVVDYLRSAARHRDPVVADRIRTVLAEASREPEGGRMTRPSPK